MSKRKPEITLGIFTDADGEHFAFNPPLDSFEKYFDACKAICVGIHGTDYYSRDTAPKPTEEEFIDKGKEGVHEITVARTLPFKRDRAVQNIVETFEDKYDTIVNLDIEEQRKAA